MSRDDRAFPLLLLCFFFSGLAALIYETAWTCEFAFVFGTSELAVATVLAAYMGGLAAGAALAGRLVRRVGRPVLVYGLLELGIALAALAVPLGIAASRWLYVVCFGGQEALPDAGGLATALFYLSCSFAILVIPTAMMGATLPLLARHAVREAGQIGRRVGVLYAANTTGAVAGVLIGAFLLLPAFGLRATIAAAAGVNAVVFLVAWALARRAPPPADAPEPGASDEGPARPTGPPRAAWILPLICLSGFVSFSYEVLWVRLLGQIVGSGVHAFATMLASFLLGIALGAAIASRLASSARRAASGFAIAQLGIAALSVAAFRFVDRLPGLADALRLRGVDKLWTDTGACMVTLFPAALAIGATFPFAVRLLARDGGDAGPASARAYAWNTLGSIAGSIAAGFLLVPELGFEGTLGFCAAANLAIAAAASGLLEPRRPWLLAAAAAGAAALALFPPSTPWGVLRATSMGVGARAFGKVAYYGVGRSSTVLVTEQRFGFSLRTNGLPESGMPRRDAWHNRAPTVRWLTALPVVARPETRSMLVVGFGGGMLLEVVPPTVERIDVIELEPEVIESNRRVAAERWRDPLADPRIHVHLNDARNALLLANTRFDAIVSQPSHPWAGGAAHLYTQEFFELVASRLSPDGVFVQWIGLPFVDEELLGSLLAALSQVFEHVQAYQPPPGGSMLFLCSNRPFDMPRSVARALARAGDDLGLIGITAPEDVLASLQLDAEGVRALAAEASPNRDAHNRLQSRSARLGEDSLARRSDPYLAPYDPLVKSLPEDVDVFYLLRRLDPPERVARVAAELADPVDRQVGEALALISEGKPVGARRALEEALEAAPRHAEARAALLRLSTSQLVRGRDPAEVVAPPLLEEERLVVRAWMARAEDPSGAALLALDDELAGIPLQHPLGPDAARLRALARLQSGEPARIDEAVRIVEETLGDRPDPRSLLVRAEVYAEAGEHAVVLEALDSFARRLATGPQGAWREPLLRRARELAREVPDDDPELYWMRRRVLGQLGGGRWRG